MRQSDKEGRQKHKQDEERKSPIATETDKIMSLSLGYDEVCKDIPTGSQSRELLLVVIYGLQNPYFLMYTECTNSKDPHMILRRLKWLK